MSNSDASASANRVKPAETMAVFIPSRFRVRMKVFAPGVTAIRACTLAMASSSSPARRATLSRSEASKSISPRMADSVIAATLSPTPASSARRSITSFWMSVESTSRITIRFDRRPRPSGWMAMSTGRSPAVAINNSLIF